MNEQQEWDVQIATPVEDQRMAVFLFENNNGKWAGNAHGPADEMPLTSLMVTDTRLSWDQELRHPIRLSLHFDVKVNGDALLGTATAGAFLRSKVIGQRQQPHEQTK